MDPAWGSGCASRSAAEVDGATSAPMLGGSRAAEPSSGGGGDGGGERLCGERLCGERNEAGSGAGG